MICAYVMENCFRAPSKTTKRDGVACVAEPTRAEPPLSEEDSETPPRRRQVQGAATVATLNHERGVPESGIIT